MFNDWLICIFSYNRGAFLQNLLDSIRQFYPDMQVAIFDDGSDDIQTIKVLSGQKERGVYIYSVSKDEGDCKHGGLYELMNIAIKYAVDQNYKYAYFVQDDMQFLWRDEELNERIARFFQNPDCLMCNLNFLQKITRKEVADKFKRVDTHTFTLNDCGVVDTGVIHVSKAQEVQLNFPVKNEFANGSFWHEKGYNVYFSTTPHLAWIPWPTTFKYRNKESQKVYSVEALSNIAIRRIKDNISYPFLEDFSHTRKFLPKPYWYSVNPGVINLIKIYIKYYLGIPLKQCSK